MQKQMLVATRAMRYDGRDVEAGERFTATPVDAPYLVRSKRARVAPDTAIQATTPATHQEGRVATRSQARGQAPSGRRTPGYYSNRAVPAQPGTTDAEREG